MKNKHKILLLILIILVAGSLAVNVVLAQGRAYSISRSVIGSGGLGASGGDVSISSTLGQTITGSVNNGTVTAWAGFWTELNDLLNKIFLPLILK